MSGQVDFYTKPGEVEKLRSLTESQGQLHSNEEMAKTITYLKGSTGQPDNWAETALKWFSYPAQALATATAKALAPDDIARDFSFSMPESAHDQHSFTDLALASLGYERGDMFRNAGATLAGFAGLGLDMLADPTLIFNAPGTMTKGVATLKMALAEHGSQMLRAATRADVGAGLKQALAGGAQALRTGADFAGLRARLQAGENVFPLAEHIAKGVAKGDGWALRAKAGIDGQNQLLKELESSGFLARPETEQLANRMVEEGIPGGRPVGPFERTKLGGGRLVSAGIPFTHAQPSAGPGAVERGVAAGLSWVGEKFEGGRDKLMVALGAVERGKFMQHAAAQVQAQGYVDDKTLYLIDRELGATVRKMQGSAATHDQVMESLHMLEHAVIDQPVQFQIVQDMIAFRNDPKRFNKLAGDPAVVKEHSLAMRSQFGRDEAYYQHRGFRPKEMEEVLRSGQAGDIELAPGKSYRVMAVDEDTSVAAKMLYVDMKGLPGWGQAGVSRDRIVVRRLQGGEIPASQMRGGPGGHLDQLQRVLALAAQRQWAPASGKALEAALSFSPSGTVQVIDPTIFVQYGAREEALAAAHEATHEMLMRVAPRVNPSVQILADPAIGLKVTADSPRKALMAAAVDFTQAMNPQAVGGVWDRGALASGIDNPMTFDRSTVKAVAETITKGGAFPPVRITIDPNTGRILLADEASGKLMAAAEFLERAEVPIQQVRYTGEVFEEPKLARNISIPDLQQKEIYARLESLKEHGLAGEETILALRRAGLSEQAVEMLRTTRFVNDAGEEVVGLRTAYEGIMAESRRARQAATAALSGADPLQAERMLEQVFRPAGAGFDVDRTGMETLLRTLGDSKAGKNLGKSAASLDKRVAELEQFLQQLDPAVLGQPRMYAVTPQEGTMRIVPLLDMRGPLAPDYAAQGLVAGSRLAQKEKLHPLTMLEVARHPADPGLVRGTGQRIPLSAMGERPKLATAAARLDEEDLKAAVALQKSKFTIDPERRAQLLSEGVVIDPKNDPLFKDRRIPDTEVHSFIRLPGETTIWGHNIGETEVIKQKVFGAVPHSVQEWGRADQSAIHVWNLQWGMMEGMHAKQMELMNARLKGLAQDMLRAGHHPDKRLLFADYLAMDQELKKAMFGDFVFNPPTLREVASGEYKAVIPKGWEGRVIDVAAPTAGGVFTIRGTSDGVVQLLADAWRQVIHTDLGTEEIMAKLMLPSSMRYGYFARILTPEGRKAIDAWFTAVAEEQKGGLGGKIYSYINKHYRKRTLSSLSTREINELFDSGEIIHNGEKLTREALLKVKTKDGADIAKALKDDPEALSYFVTDVQDAMLIRAMAGKRSLRNATLVDHLREFAVEVLPGQKEIPLATARDLVRRAKAGETLTEREAQVAKLLTEPGHYQAVLSKTEAQALVAKGELELDMISPLGKGDAFMAVEGRMFEHPRWQSGAIRFMPREVLAEMNRTYQKITNIPSLNAFAAGWHGLQNMWKRPALFLVPKFYLRNIVGDMLLAWQGGLNPLDLSTHAEAWRALQGYKQYTRFGKASLEAGELELRAGGKAERGIHPLTEITNGRETMTWEQFIEQMNTQGGFHGMYARQLHKNLNETLAGRGIVSMNDMPLDTPFSKANWGKPIEGAIEQGIKIHEGIENHFRMAIAYRNWKDGKGIVESINIAKKVMGDVRDLTPIEKTFAVGVMPFYRWMRFNIPRQVMWHIERPDQALRMWSAVQNIGRGGADVSEEELPEWARAHYNLVMGKKDGVWGFIGLDGFLPAADLLQLQSLATDPGEFGADTLLKGISPIIRTPMEAMMGRTLEGQQLETVPGELSNMALSQGMLNVPGLTRRAGTHGPLGAANLLWNEQAFNLMRPVKELSQLIGLFHQPEKEMGAALRNYMLVKVSTSDPVRQEILHMHDRQKVFTELKGKYRAAVREGNEAKQRYWLGQINAHAVWGVGR